MTCAKINALNEVLDFIFSFSACLVSILGMAVLSFLTGQDKVLAVLMLTLIGFAAGASAGGPAVNQIDLSPRYAGIIMAITNSCSTVFSIIGPLVVQLIVKDEVGKNINHLNCTF